MLADTSRRQKGFFLPYMSKLVRAKQKPTVKVEGTSTHANMRSFFLMAYKCNYNVDHALPAQFQPLADVQPGVSRRTRDEAERISTSNISHRSFIMCPHSRDQPSIHGTYRGFY